MTGIDPRVQHWLDKKNALTRRFLAAVKVQAARIATDAPVDKAIATVIPALKFYNKPYGISDAQYANTDKAARDFIATLDEAASKSLFEKSRRCRELFSAAHSFWESQLHFHTFAQADNSIDFIAVTLRTDPEGNSDLPADALFRIDREESSHGSARVELHKTITKLRQEIDEREIINITNDWNGTGVIIRNAKMHENARYTANYFKSYGVRCRFIETFGPNTRPNLGGLWIGRT